ncbi:MAG: phage integrase SAM-like domain-containing protein [Bacteroidota bacterium]
MNKLPKPRFNLKSPNSEKETLILMIFRYRGKKVQYSTGLNISPSDWNKKDNRAFLKERRSDLILLNKELDKLSSFCTDIYITSEYGNINVDRFKYQLKIKTGEALEKRLSSQINVPKDGISFFEFIEKEIAELREANMKESTLEPLRIHVKLLKEFAIDYDISNLFTFEDVDWNFRLKLIDWLASRNLQLAYGNKTLKILKRFLESARRQKLHLNTEYQGKGWTVPTKKAKGQHVFFSVSELSRLAELRLSSRLSKIRDLCLIGAGTGQRFSDFSKYKSEQFSTSFNGIPLITVISDKTDIPAKIPLNIFPWLIPVLEKYNYTSPKMSMQKFNDGLKELADLVGFNDKILVVKQFIARKARVEKCYVEKHKLVSSHLCRRSFATNMYRMGFKLSQIMPMTGHSTESQLREYIGIDNEQNAEEVGMMFI